MQALTERGEVEEINPQMRMDILARIMEVCSQLEFIGVMNDDVHPRNLIVAKGAEQKWHITLIDFSHSRVKDLPNSKWRTLLGQDQHLPESPTTTFWGAWPDGCSDWVPKQYDGETKDSFERALKWMKDRWEGSSRYKPANYEWVRGPYEDDYTEDVAIGEGFCDDDCSRGGTSKSDSAQDGSTGENSTTDGDSKHPSSSDDNS